jgi:streptogramin lyase
MAQHVVVGEGSVWVAGASGVAGGDFAASGVTRIDPTAHAVVATFPGTTAYGCSIAVGEGAAWVSGPSSGIARIDAASNAVTTIQTAGSGWTGPCASAPSLDAGGGFSWASWQVLHLEEILRIDPETGEITRVELPGKGDGVVAELDGRVWVDARTDDGPRLVGLDPATGAIVSVIPRPRDVSGHQAVSSEGGFGSLWAPSADGLLRIDPSTGSVIDVASRSAGELSIAIGESAVWVGSSGGSVLRIDPATNAIVGELDLGFPVVDIAVGEGAVWVVDGEGTLYRIDPDAVAEPS